jgi:hypothetical protein
MGGEEFPYPGLAYLLGLKRLPPQILLSAEDEDVFKRIDLRVNAQYAFDDTMDLVVMHARTSCPGVKPAMKNLAVFLKHS